MRSKCFACIAACLFFSAAFCASAYAGWTVTILHPAGYTRSFATGVSGGKQVGGAQTTGGSLHAFLWTGTAASGIDLHPAGTDSVLTSVSGNQEAGRASYGDSHHASVWSGTVASWVDLHPTGFWSSILWGTTGTQQVGSTTLSSSSKAHASLWSGTASFVDLHPGGSWTESCAKAISGGQQAGYVINATSPSVWNSHAGIWNGTAATWLDLNPAGCTDSMAYGVSGGKQVGWAGSNPGAIVHAALWSGTAASWVDLHPVGCDHSRADAVCGGVEVGYVRVPGVGENWHASLWSGTAASWVDLHSLLPAGYSASEAEGVDIVNWDIWVVGWARNSTTGQQEAALWHYHPIVGLTKISDALDPIMNAAQTRCDIAVRGTVTRLDSDTFRLNDGTGQLKVICPEHGRATGDGVRAEGTLDNTTTPLATLTTSAERLH